MSGFWTRRRERAARALCKAGYWHDAMPMSALNTLRAFLIFHDDNPDVLDDVVQMARGLKASGKPHGEIRMFLGDIRSRRELESRGGRFKFSNSHGAWYARLAMATCPDLAGFFELRQLGKCRERSSPMTGPSGPLLPAPDLRTYD